MIPFNRPPCTGNEEKYIIESLTAGKLSGDGVFGKRCQKFLADMLGCEALLTPSCTHSLEMAALLLDVQPGDEIIMPSFTFVSTANAFVLRGARIVFVDVRADTMNIDETQIEAAITSRTKAIVPVHYAGVSCEMDAIMQTASRHQLHVVEDAAQGVLATYRGKPLGSIGHLGAYSFHETKNITSGGEGGALIIGDPKFQARAEIVREKGTNRSQFFRGEIDKYSWVDVGSSYLPSEIQAAYLWGQFERCREITSDRLASWQRYFNGLVDLQHDGFVSLPHVPKECRHNAHMFYLKVDGLDSRTRLLEHLKRNGIHEVFHYVPLHSAPAGKLFSRFHGPDQFTTSESERLIRLPMFYGLKSSEIDRVVGAVRQFFGR